MNIKIMCNSGNKAILCINSYLKKYLLFLPVEKLFFNSTKLKSSHSLF